MLVPPPPPRSAPAGGEEGRPFLESASLSPHGCGSLQGKHPGETWEVREGGPVLWGPLQLKHGQRGSQNFLGAPKNHPHQCVGPRQLVGTSRRSLPRHFQQGRNPLNPCVDILLPGTHRAASAFLPSPWQQLKVATVLVVNFARQGFYCGKGNWGAKTSKPGWMLDRGSEAGATGLIFCERGGPVPLLSTLETLRFGPLGERLEREKNWSWDVQRVGGKFTLDNWKYLKERCRQRQKSKD